MKLTPVEDKEIKLEPIKRPVKKKKPAPPPKKQLSEVEKALIQLKELLAISTAKTADLVETNASVLRKTLEQLNKRQKIEFNPEITIKEEENPEKMKEWTFKIIRGRKDTTVHAKQIK